MPLLWEYVGRNRTVNIAGKGLGSILITIGIIIIIGAAITGVAQYFVKISDPTTGITKDIFGIKLTEGDIKDTNLFSLHNIVGFGITLVLFIGVGIVWGVGFYSI
jgi:hypothetical protein